jgi:hypothetical protein
VDGLFEGLRRWPQNDRMTGINLDQRQALGANMLIVSLRAAATFLTIRIGRRP